MLDFQSTPELDYNFLLWTLKRYRRPRDQISRLLRSGDLTRVKKGLYIRSDSFSEPFSTYILANLIYGPSYVSGHSALAYWGLIPERVEAIESACWHRNKQFQTPVGLFIYQKVLSQDSYPEGLTRAFVGENRSFLIAGPEKAILESYQSCAKASASPSAGFTAWANSMRIETEAFAQMSIKTLKRLKGAFSAVLVDTITEQVRKARA